MEITLKLTVDEINMVLVGLGKLPIENGVAVWMKVKTSAEQQLNAVQAPAVEEAQPVAEAA